MFKNELISIIKESFEFNIKDQNSDKLVIEYKNEEDKNKLIGKTIIPLNNLTLGITKEMNAQL